MANTPDDKDPVKTDTLSQPEAETGPEQPAPTESETPPATDGTEAQGDAPRDLADTIDEATAAWDDARPTAEPAPAAAPKAAKPAPAPQARGGFLAPVIGGVLAAGLGFAAANVIQPEGWPFPGSGAGLGDEMRAVLAASDARLAETQAQIGALQDQIAALAEAGNAGAEALAPQIAALAEQTSGLSGRTADLADRLAGLDARVEDLSKAQLAVAGEQAAEAVAAYEREIAAMRAELATQRDENAQLAESVSAVADRAEAEVDAAMDRAAQIEARAALMRIDAALASGAAFDGALDQFAGVEMPDVLARLAAQGAPTLATLQRDFPPAARAALDAALRVEAAGSAGDRVNAFLRSQLGLRSLAPREGDDADAVLSRAEAALRGGDLRAALTELDALPDPARDEMSGWIAAATDRADALEAARALEQSLNQ
ncbi:COG4223 family protein [Rhodovulum steppense]|uniref:Inner membrane protein n=1 Tax=Rhodovulum steppense TaxID=540251 RepID=A0A4V2R3Z9_9RHOB|nr:hypothetical protein [Rhodovulum steppense]TCM80012.1 hypothetical protein EV216_12149 [Rhodovulum steppense]